MTHTIKNDADITEEDIEDISESINGDEFVFVLDSEGNLKTVILPGDAEEENLPENVTKVLQVFDLNTLEAHTIH